MPAVKMLLIKCVAYRGICFMKWGIEMIYYTTYENYVDAAVLTDIEILPNIRCMVWVLPFEPVYMLIDRVKANEIRKEWKNESKQV